MNETDFLKLLQDEGTSIVELCSGTIADGRDFHAFIKMTAANRQRYHEDLAKRAVMDLNAYGEILHTGWGKEPDEAASAFIMQTCTDNLKLLETIGRDAAAMEDILRRNSKSKSEHMND